jgi:hypothetical protein
MTQAGRSGSGRDGSSTMLISLAEDTKRELGVHRQEQQKEIQELLVREFVTETVRVECHGMPPHSRIDVATSCDT